ncbi:MAG: hypothetical protein NC548_50960 [Lachnospiraceae bacterium]|nr:hypothetical protein [Lachnospiraceae bacterium]
MTLYDKSFEGCTSKQIFDLPEVYHKSIEIKALGSNFKVEPSIEEIITYTFITNGTNRFGYYSGIAALHHIHGITQVPVVIDIKSNKTDKDLTYKSGASTYNIHPANITVTKDNAIYLEISDCLEDWYDYFDNIPECLRYLIKELSLQEEKFKALYTRYSNKTIEAITDAFKLQAYNWNSRLLCLTDQGIEIKLNKKVTIVRKTQDTEKIYNTLKAIKNKELESDYSLDNIEIITKGNINLLWEDNFELAVIDNTENILTEETKRVIRDKNESTYRYFILDNKDYI